MVKMPSGEGTLLEWLLFKQSGVITYAQATQHISPAAVRHKLARGDWRRIFRGVILATAGRMTAIQQWQAAVLAAGEGSVLAGLAAAQAGGLQVKSKRLVIDVLLPAARRAQPLPKALLRDMAVVKVHRTRQLERWSGQPARTLMARSVVDAAQWAIDDDEARLIVASACQQRKVLPQEVIAALGMTRVKRSALIRQTAEFAEGGATTLTEIDLVRLCRKHGIPKPDMQVHRKDASGRNRYLDAYWEEQKLHVEVDGAHHMEARHWEADMVRQNEVWLKGDRVLRFPAHLVKVKPEIVVRQIQKALGVGEVFDGKVR